MTDQSTPAMAASGPQDAPEVREAATGGRNLRESAYTAVYAYIRALGDQLPPDPVHRNAVIWRAVNAALDAIDDPYRQLLDRLQQERDRSLRNARQATLPEARLVNDGIAAGLRIAAAHAITLFDGDTARAEYLAADDEGEQPARTILNNPLRKQQAAAIRNLFPLTGDAAVEELCDELERLGGGDRRWDAETEHP